jgi:hypothetical protein
MILTEPNIRRLTPAVATWLERDVHPDTLRHTLTDHLPEPLTHPAALLAYRLTEHLPPPLPATPPTLVTAPFQDCEGCTAPSAPHNRAAAATAAPTPTQPPDASPQPARTHQGNPHGQLAPRDDAPRARRASRTVGEAASPGPPGPPVPWSHRTS